MTADDSRSRWLARIVVLATGIVLGFFIWWTYFDYVPHLYPVEFRQGQWLVASDGGPQGYFRKELYIPSAIRHAWIMVAATDSFILYLNGKAVEGKGYASLNVSGIYDIGPYLHPGKNVLGMEARRLSFPGAAMAVVEGAYLDEGGRQQGIASDTSWQFSPVEQRQGNGDILWYSESFDATSWPTALSAGHPHPSEIYPLSAHPLAFTLPPQGKWIGYSSSLQDRPTFSYTLRLPTKAVEAWLRIAAARSYTLVVNGVAVQGEASRDLPAVGMDGTSIWKKHDSVSTDLYNITPLLQTGLNRITVSSEGSPFRPGLFVDGFVIHGGELLTFGTEATWTITLASGTANDHVSTELHTLTLANSGPFPAKTAMKVVTSLNHTTTQMARMFLVHCLTAGLLYALWHGTSRILGLFHKGGAMAAASADALVHLPITLALCTLFLLTFDVRFYPQFPFQPRVVLLAVMTLLVFKSVLLLEAWHRMQKDSQASLSASLNPAPGASYFYIASLICLTLVGAVLRLSNLDAQSLYHDEIHMVNFVQGLLEKGYPAKMIGPIERPLATYELVPYPLALSATFLGINDFALRLPASLFGTATILLIYVAGKQLFDQRIGLLASAIYTFCPQALIWAQYLWHPQQTQFFSLLTVYLFYQAIRSTPLSPYYLYPAALFFIITYFSWEGTGFFLPALGIGLLAAKGWNFTWIRDKHLWLTLVIIFIVIVLQLTRRTLLQVPYLVVGQGLSDISLPTFYFLDPMYDPIFYLKNFFWLENNILLTLLLLGGLLFIIRQTGFLYCCAVLISVMLMMANLLSNASARYVYYLQPILILVSSFVVFFILDHSSSLMHNNRYYIIRIADKIFITSFIIIIIFGSTIFTKLHRLTDFSNPKGTYIRNGVYYIDYRSTAKYVEFHYQHGDLVIAVMPGALEYYSEVPSHYFIETYSIRQVLHDPIESSIRYIERTVGKPLIRDHKEFQEIIKNHKRVWVIAVPYSLFLKLIGEEIRESIQKQGRLVYESYNSRVYFLQI